jgi:hypothetical protein
MMVGSSPKRSNPSFRVGSAVSFRFRTCIYLLSRSNTSEQPSLKWPDEPLQLGPLEVGNSTHGSQTLQVGCKNNVNRGMKRSMVCFEKNGCERFGENAQFKL